MRFDGTIGIIGGKVDFQLKLHEAKGGYIGLPARRLMGKYCK